MIDRLSELFDSVDSEDASLSLIDPFTVEVTYSDGSTELLEWSCASSRWRDCWSRSCERGLPGN